MRSIFAMGAALAAMSTIRFSDAVLDTVVPFVREPKRPRSAPNAPTRLYRTGERYPHSSKRQRARYARQIAAGQLNIQAV